MKITKNYEGLIDVGYRYEYDDSIETIESLDFTELDKPLYVSGSIRTGGSIKAGFIEAAGFIKAGESIEVWSIKAWSIRTGGSIKAGFIKAGGSIVAWSIEAGSIE